MPIDLVNPRGLQKQTQAPEQRRLAAAGLITENCTYGQPSDIARQSECEDALILIGFFRTFGAGCGIHGQCE